MPHSSLSPLSVVQYNRDYIIEFVRYITGWNERSEVKNKAQLQYVCKYLEVNHINCQTIVVESDYIERHYLEDNAEYYARCFPSHPRKCSRLHFFSTSFSEIDFNKCLLGGEEELENRIRSGYIGFVVIRPIPHTVFARICLRPYDALISDENCVVLARDIQVSLFGLNLSIKTIPFIEQDKVVSACATSALWVALSAHSDISINRIPSPSEITKRATVSNLDGGRTFPTTGLSVPQILQGLRHFGLEPSIIWNDKSQSINELKSQIYGYISNETTVILGGAIYSGTASDATYLGSHLICVTGFSTEPLNTQSTQSNQLFYSERVNKIYVHDDRSGPYLRLKTDQINFKSGEDPKIGLVMNVEGLVSNFFVPSIAIVGVYHKIRIPYFNVHSACEALYQYILKSNTDLLNVKRKGDAATKTMDENISTCLKDFLAGYWDITLTTSSKIKSEIRVSPDFLSFNGHLSKSALLIQNMPKYIWRCRIMCIKDGQRKPLSDIFIDATEVPQGNIFLGSVAYSLNAVQVWVYIGICIRDRSWQSFTNLDPRAKEYIGCFIKFFSQDRNNAYLNTMYGPLGLPRRPLKEGEEDVSHNISRRTDTFTIRRGDNKANWKFLKKPIKYIWIVNDVGDIVVGQDVAENEDFKGHPTLIDGRPGRIAGELFFDNNVAKWKLNLKSRAYSGHVQPNEREDYIKKVIKYNFHEFEVVPDLVSR
jgi:hypothetical protein